MPESRFAGPYKDLVWDLGPGYGGFPSIGDSRDINSSLLYILQQLNIYGQQYLGLPPITITSGKRSSVFNAKIGGHPTSYHLDGHAADISISGMSEDQIKWIKVYLNNNFDSQLFEVVDHGAIRHIHIAVRKGSERPPSAGVVDFSTPGEVTYDVTDPNVPGFTQIAVTEVPIDVYRTSFADLKDITDEEKSPDLSVLAKKPGAFKYGDTWLTVPPVAIQFTEQNNIAAIPTLRTKGNVYWRTGANSMNIDLEFLFPGKKEINDELRHVIAQVKRCPFLPLENYLLHTLIFPRIGPAVPQPEIPYEFQIEEKSEIDRGTAMSDTLRPQQWRIKNKKFEDIVKMGDEKSLLEYIEKGKQYGYFESEADTDREARSAQLDRLYEWMKTYRHIDVTDTGLSYRDQQLVVAIRGLTVSSVPGFPSTMQLNCSCDLFNYFPYSNIFAFNKEVGGGHKPVFNISKGKLFKRYYQGLLSRNGKKEFPDSFDSETRLEAIGNQDRDILHLSYLYSKDTKNRSILAQQSLIAYLNNIEKITSEDGEPPPAQQLFDDLFTFLTSPLFKGWGELAEVPGDIIEISKDYFKQYGMAVRSIVAAFEFYEDRLGKYFLGLDSNNEIYIIDTKKGKMTFLRLRDVHPKSDYLVKLARNLVAYEAKLRTLDYETASIVLGDGKSHIIGYKATMETKLSVMQILGFVSPTYQHLGNSEWTVSLTIETGDPDVLRDLKEMSERLNTTALSQTAVLQQIRSYADLSAKVVESPLFRMLGIENVIIGNFRYGTVEDKPGLYQIYIDFVQSDLNLRKYEALQSPAYFSKSILHRVINALPEPTLERGLTQILKHKGDYKVLREYKSGKFPFVGNGKSYPHWNKLLYHLCKPVPKKITGIATNIPVYKLIQSESVEEITRTVEDTKSNATLKSVAETGTKFLFNPMTFPFVAPAALGLTWLEMVSKFFPTAVDLGLISKPPVSLEILSPRNLADGLLALNKATSKAFVSIYKGAIALQIKALLQNALIREGVPSGMNLGTELTKSIMDSHYHLNIRNTCYPDLELPTIVEDPDFWFYKEDLVTDNIRNLAEMYASNHRIMAAKLFTINAANKHGKATTAMAKLKSIEKKLEVGRGLALETLLDEVNKLLDDAAQSYIKDAEEESVLKLEMVNQKMRQVDELIDSKDPDLGNLETLKQLRIQLIQLREYYNDSLGLFNFTNFNDPSERKIAMNLVKNWGFLTPRTAELERQILGDCARLNEGKTLSIGRAFPTFKVYLIEKDKPEWLLFDDFYGYGAVKSIQIRKTRKSPIHTAIVTFSNLTSVLSDIRAPANEDISAAGTAEEQDVNSMLLKEGAEIMVKMGYSNDPDALERVFQGSVVSVQPGAELTIMAQGWGAELASPIRDFGIGITSTVRDFGDVATTILDRTPGLRHFGTTYNLAELFDDYDQVSFEGDYRETYFNRLKNWTMQGLGIGPFIDHRDDNIYLPYNRSPSLWPIEVFEGKGIGFDWSVTGKNAWEALDEVIQYSPGYIMKILPYDDINLQSSRCTLYIGPRDGYYIAGDDYEQVDEMKMNESQKYQQRRLEWYRKVKSVTAPSFGALVNKLKEFDIRYEFGDDRNINPPYMGPEDVSGYIIPTGKQLISVGIHNRFVEQSLLVKDGTYSLAKADPYNPLLCIKTEHAMDFGWWSPLSWLPELHKQTLKGLGVEEICLFWLPKFAKANYFELINNPNTYKRTNIYDIYDKIHIDEYGRVYGLPGLLESLMAGRERFTYGKDGNPDLVAGKHGWKRACNYHFVDSHHHIIENNMIASREKMYNKVRLIYPKGEPQAQVDETNLDLGDTRTFELSADDNIKPDMVKIHQLYFDNIDVPRVKNFLDTIENAGAIIGIDPAPKGVEIPPYAIVANSILTNDLKDMYDGELVILLDPTIDVHDTVYVYDDVNDVYGPITVKEVYHYFSVENGAYTVIVPDLVVFPSNMEQTLETGYMSALFSAIVKMNQISLLGVAAGVGLSTLGGHPYLGAGLAIASGVFAYKLSSAIGIGGVNKLLGREACDFIPLWHKNAPFVAGLEGYRKDDLLVHYGDKVHTMGDAFRAIGEAVTGLQDEYYLQTEQRFGGP